MFVKDCKRKINVYAIVDKSLWNDQFEVSIISPEINNTQALFGKFRWLDVNLHSMLIIIFYTFSWSIYEKENVQILYCKLPIPDEFMHAKQGMMFCYAYAFVKKKERSRKLSVKYEDLSVHNSANFRVVEMNSSDSGIDIICCN